MPNEKKEKLLCVESLRHSEYYNMQGVFDDLYARSKNGDYFDNLMEVILSPNNILLAYRNIKTNAGSRTPGTDRLNIDDIGKLPPEKVIENVIYFVRGSNHGYRPKPVRRKDIPKPNGTTRPLGIPCIWDRLIQQCIKQVMEPICEAKFSDNCYGFRPERSVENAISQTYKYIQRSNLHYVIEFDIKGFFDNVNHAKLIRQIWALGIHDKHLLFVIKRILTAPIKMPDGSMCHPQKGTPQGGIISPLLANIVLNELDHWVESQWQKNPISRKYSISINGNGSENLSHGYRAMRKTKLKEMYIVRYADDFRIFCRTKTDAQKTMLAVTQWLQERLRLEVSVEKTRIVNVKRKYSEFLGFKIRVHPKGKKQVIESHICDKQLKRISKAIHTQALNIERIRPKHTEANEVRLYNSMVMGIQNYYCIATHINKDCAVMQYQISNVFKNRLNRELGGRLVKQGRNLTKVEFERYGQSTMIRYVAGCREPIYPIGYVQHKNPMAIRRGKCRYTPEGRTKMHDNLRINVRLMHQLMSCAYQGVSTEYADNRISRFSAQWGKCAITGRDFTCLADIHCHHIVPVCDGGSDKYQNLVLLLEPVHKLIHAKRQDTIDKYLAMLVLNENQIRKVNDLRAFARLTPIYC